MQFPEIINQLMRCEPPGLAVWMAYPADVETALCSLGRLQQRIRAGNLDEKAVFTLRLGEIIARFWAGKDIEAGYKNLLALLDGAQQESVLELCVGQLLMARKLLPAWEHLERGFQLAAHLLEPEDYFLVMKRHDLLRQLSLSQQGMEAVDLETLLSEARVIASLRGKATRRGEIAPGHQDTVD